MNSQTPASLKKDWFKVYGLKPYPKHKPLDVRRELAALDRAEKASKKVNFMVGGPQKKAAPKRKRVVVKGLTFAQHFIGKRQKRQVYVIWTKLRHPFKPDYLPCTLTIELPAKKGRNK